MKEVSAILLAAGQSRRMGAFKPLLPFGDQTVIESCLDNLRAAGIENIVVVVGHRGEEIRERLKESQVRFAENPDPDSEMGASIARGLEQVSTEARSVIIALVDHPAAPPDAIKSIITEWQRGAGKLIQPEHGGRGGHPVLVDLSYRDELMHLDPRRGLRACFDAHRSEVRRIAVDSPYVARDMDTWEDYQQLHEEVFGRPPTPN